MNNETNTHDELNLFLKDSPYTESERREITLYIDGLEENKQSCCLNDNKEESQ